MIFSKSFAYALRGILCISHTVDGTTRIRVEDISKETGIPKHFLGKIMNKMVKAGMVSSIKGPSGGFSITDKTLEVPLIDLYYLFDGAQLFEECSLYFKTCSDENACPIHFKVKETKNNIRVLLTASTIGDLLKEDKRELLKNIAIG